ncbi:MAG: hypothetical protein ACXV5Q_14795 [Frankiaceae bacterium]
MRVARWAGKVSVITTASSRDGMAFPFGMRTVVALMLPAGSVDIVVPR